MSHIDRELDRIFNTYDDLFLDGKFADADALLSKVDVEALCVDVLVGYLCITSCAKDKLPHRAEFVRQVEAKFVRDVPDRVAALMDGLR